MSYPSIKVCIKGNLSGRYLNIDANGMSAFNQDGSGTVNGTTTLTAFSTLWLECYPNGTCAIRAPGAPGVYLRFDNSTNASHNDDGVGIVNCQYVKEASPPDGKEIFALRSQTDGSCAIESVSQPGNFLRMAADGVVNLQFWAPNTKIIGSEIVSILLLN